MLRCPLGAVLMWQRWHLETKVAFGNFSYLTTVFLGKLIGGSFSELNANSFTSTSELSEMPDWAYFNAKLLLSYAR